MPRPDPRTIARQPMARAQSQIAWTGGGRSQSSPREIFRKKCLNLDSLHHLLETAEIVSEGRIDPLDTGDRFFGSTVITVDLTQIVMVDKLNERLCRTLVEAMEADERAQRVIQDRVFREIARLLGAQTSIDFEAQTRTVRDGFILRIISDFESSIAGEEAIGP